MRPLKIFCGGCRAFIRRLGRIHLVGADVNLVSGCPGARIRSFPRVWLRLAEPQLEKRVATLLALGITFFPLLSKIDELAKCQLIFIGCAQRVAHNAAYRFTELRRRWKCHATLWTHIECHRFSRVKERLDVTRKHLTFK